MARFPGIAQPRCLLFGAKTAWKQVTLTGSHGTSAAKRAMKSSGIIWCNTVGRHVNGVFAASLATDGLPLRHAPEVVGTAVMRILRAGRVKRYRATAALAGDRPPIQTCPG